MIVTVFTICPSVVFVLVEIFRETKADGSAVAKTSTETSVEGICFLILVLAWIPTVMVATTPSGAASLIGNSYFFTWLLIIFISEGLIWYIHDKRRETQLALKRTEAEYKRQQRLVLKQAMEVQQKKEERENRSLGVGIMERKESTGYLLETSERSPSISASRHGL